MIKLKVGKSFWIFVLLSGITLSAAIMIGDPLFYRAFYFWLGLFLFSIVWTATSLWKVNLRRTSRELQMEVGDLLEEKFEIENQSFLRKTWIEVSDNSQIAGTTGSRVLVNIAPRTIKQYTAHSHLVRRGKYLLGPTIIKSGDIFGIFGTEEYYNGEKFLLVSPRVFNINLFSRSTSFLSGGSSTRTQSRESTAYVSGVREYQPGDPLKIIHWQSTAKNQNLIVKEYDKDPQAEVIILLDIQDGPQWEIERKIENKPVWIFEAGKRSTIIPASMEYLTSIAASLANTNIKNDIATGLIYSMTDVIVISPEKGERQFQKILEQLSLMNPTSQKSIFGFTNIYKKEIHQGSQVIILTAGYDDSILLTIEELRSRNLDVIVVMLNRDSFRVFPSNSLLAERINGTGVRCYFINECVDIQELQTALAT